MAVRLTESAIAKASREVGETGKRRDLADAGCPGLRLRVSPPPKDRHGDETGAPATRSWVLACRDREGRMRRFPLGAFPTVGVAEAREKARALHVQVKQAGADPVAERRKDRAIARDAKAGIGTLAALLTLYGDKQGSKLKTWTECQRRVESVFAPFLQRPLATMARHDLQLAADTWPSQQSAAAAVRYLRPILKWAEHRGYVPAGLATIAPPVTVRRRDRVLSRDELGALLPALRASARPYAACMRFMLLTLSRREEAAAARWRDVDLIAGTWTILETKNGQPHVVPLSRQAIELLHDLMRVDDRGGRITPAGEARIFATVTGEALTNWDREAKQVMEACGVTGWTRHDLRRTAATMLGEMGELPDIIEAALNHVAIRSQLAATYNRSRYRPQVAAALQRLADALDGIERGGAQVVQLRPAVSR